jgi:hypothetical protein
MGVILDAKPTSAGNRTVFICSAPARRTQSSPFIWGCLAIFLVVSALLILFRPFGHKAPNSASLNFARASAPLSQFHRALYALDEQFNDATLVYERVSSKALQDHNLLALFDATNQYEGELDRLYEDTITIPQPHSRNAESVKWADLAITILRSRLFMLRSANHLMVYDVDSGLSNQSDFRAFEKAHSVSLAKSIEENSAIRRSYEALGVSAEDLHLISINPNDGRRR